MEGLKWAVLVIGITLLTVTSSKGAIEETCEDIQPYIIPNYNGNYHYLWYVWSRYYGDEHKEWHNMSFWGGHWQIPTKDNQDNKCFATWANGLVVLLEKHPEIGSIGNDVIKLDACSLNRNGICQSTMEVKVRNCNGDLLYGFPWYDPDNADTWNQYICFDAIYRDTCSDTDVLYSAGNVHGNFLNFSDGDVKLGWFNGFINGKQYVFPSTEDLETVADECFQYYWGYVLQEPVPETITETPVRLAYCSVYYDYGNDDGSYIIGENCNSYVYARACNGKIQFDLSFMEHWWIEDFFCFIHKNNIFAQPEIRHDVDFVTTDGVTRKTFTPFLQYRCSFEMEDGYSYKIDWYINGTWQLQTGPSSLSDDLVFRENYLTDLSPGYEVQCGVIAMSGNQFNESLSDVFYAGWKRQNRESFRYTDILALDDLSDGSISLSKSGLATVSIEQTIPFGCYYFDGETPQCVEELSLVDPFYNPDTCAGTIRVQNRDDPGKSSIAVKSLKKGEETTSRKFEFKLSTVDNDYDDRRKYDLEMIVTHSTGHTNQKTVRTEIVGAVRVDVKDNERHWNKKCYSHVDPHHKTSDGLHFEMQEEHDHILYLNEAHQTEIQQSARYCYHGWNSGPVCACGIALRVGADAFVINRCHDSNFTFDYIRKDDGGIIDIVKQNDYYYKFILPTGTVVDVFLHTWSETMNIDIYMAAKDFRNVVGLCGYFDGNRTNDLLHRNNVTVSYDRNMNYAFSDSWKLTEEENLFTNPNRILKPLNVDNAGGFGQACSRANSITRKKIEATSRKRRSLPNRNREETDNQYKTQLPLSRTKRSVVNYTEEEAFSICNASIYLAPAVLEFPDKLGEEDLDKVVEQCVFDLTNASDLRWVDAHITVLNNAADAILQLNPVFVANYSDMVNSFRTKICLNNCSQYGVCTGSGNCECNGLYRGPDCSFDIRSPPIVLEVQGGDICDIDDGDDCACHQIRTINIFDGFFCQMIKFKVYFNGTRIQEGTETFEGDYHDIFTGVCCYPDDRRTRSSDDNDITVTMYHFSVSNDGNTYGEQNAVYAYETTCIEQDEINGIITFELKNDFCFIDGACVVHNNKVLSTDECYLCDPTINPYNWTKGYCEESESTEFNTAALVGIICSCVFVAVAVAGVFCYLLCCKGAKKHRAVHDSHADLQSKLADIHLPQSCKGEHKPTRSAVNTADEASPTTFPDIHATDSESQVYKQSIWITTQSKDIETSARVRNGIGDGNVVDTGIDRSGTDIEIELRNQGGVSPISVTSLECF